MAIKFLLFCEHEGKNQFFHHNGTVTIGNLKFTALKCCGCHDDIALSGEMIMELISL